MGAKCFVFSERFSALVAPIFIALWVPQSDLTTQSNQEAFEPAIAEIAAASKRPLDSLVTPRRTAAPKRDT